MLIPVFHAASDLVYIPFYIFYKTQHTNLKCEVIPMAIILNPKGLYNTITDNDIHFIQLHKESKARFHSKIDCRNKNSKHSGTA